MKTRKSGSAALLTTLTVIQLLKPAHQQTSRIEEISLSRSCSGARDTAMSNQGAQICLVGTSRIISVTGSTLQLANQTRAQTVECSYDQPICAAGGGVFFSMFNLVGSEESTGQQLSTLIELTTWIKDTNISVDINLVEFVYGSNYILTGETEKTGVIRYDFSHYTFHSWVGLGRQDRNYTDISMMKNGRYFFVAAMLARNISAIDLTTMNVLDSNDIIQSEGRLNRKYIQYIEAYPEKSLIAVASNAIQLVEINRLNVISLLPVNVGPGFTALQVYPEGNGLAALSTDSIWFFLVKDDSTVEKVFNQLYSGGYKMRFCYHFKEMVVFQQGLTSVVTLQMSGSTPFCHPNCASCTRSLTSNAQYCSCGTGTRVLDGFCKKISSASPLGGRYENYGTLPKEARTFGNGIDSDDPVNDTKTETEYPPGNSTYSVILYAALFMVMVVVILGLVRIKNYIQSRGIE